MGHPSLKKESYAKSFTAKAFFYFLKAGYCYLREDYVKANHFFKKEFELYKKNPEKIRYVFHSYIASINNILATCEKINDHAAYEEHLGILKNALSLVKNNSQKARLYFGYASFNLNYILVRGQYEKAEKIILETLKECENYLPDLSQHEKTVIYCNIAIIWFGNCDYKKCMYYLNKIRNEFSDHIHPSIHRFLNVFYILAHYELEHFDLLPRLAKEASSNMERQKPLSKFERTIFDFFNRRSLAEESVKDRAKGFIQLKKELLPLSVDQEEKQSFNFFDYLSWTESKANNRPFAEIVKLKIEKG